ncbi:MAG: RbsD/FucU domain-containing protein [Pirellulales bacterium]
MISNLRIVLALLMLATGVSAKDWSKKLQQEIPVLGHRNWIVVADSAYPAQTAPGIKTIYVGGDQLEAVAEVMKLIKTQKHVRAKVVTDAELVAVDEADAPGIDAYRTKLNELLKGTEVTHTPHENVIKKLDDAAKTFQVIIIKTDLTLPYTSVFFELDCGYWNADAEKRLREKLSAGK